MSRHAMSSPVLSCHVMSRHVTTLRHLTSFHVTSCLGRSCHVMSHRVASFSVLSLRFASCRVASCRVSSRRGHHSDSRSSLSHHSLTQLILIPVTLQPLTHTARLMCSCRSVLHPRLPAFRLPTHLLHLNFRCQVIPSYHFWVGSVPKLNARTGPSNWTRSLRRPLGGALSWRSSQLTLGIVGTASPGQRN